MTDTPTYTKTIQFLRLHTPACILVPTSAATASPIVQRHAAHADAARGRSMLVGCLEEVFGLETTPLARKYWNHEEGE